MRKARCQECGREIRFIRTKAGKNMPVNPDSVIYWQNEHGGGRIVTPEGEVVACELNRRDYQNLTGRGYVPHWATCPIRRAREKVARREAEKKAAGAQMALAF